MFIHRKIIPIILLLAASLLACTGPEKQRKRMPVPIGQQPEVLDDAPRLNPTGNEHQGFLQVRDSDGRIRQITWSKYSESVGKPNDGVLKGGIEFPDSGPGWKRKRGPAFGTDETVRLLDWAFQEMSREFPGTTPVVVGDISGEHGGPLKKHNSHQSGRDIDIGYYAKGNKPMRGFVKMTQGTFDAEKTWALVERFVVSGYVRFIFMSYVLQELLYQEALDSGWSKEELSHIFQYPRGHKIRKGLIRHARGHQDHFHLRLKCPVSDHRCVP